MIEESGKFLKTGMGLSNTFNAGPGILKNFWRRGPAGHPPHTLLSLGKVYRVLVTPLGDNDKIVEIFPTLPFHFAT